MVRCMYLAAQGDSIPKLSTFIFLAEGCIIVANGGGGGGGLCIERHMTPGSNVYASDNYIKQYCL